MVPCLDQTQVLHCDLPKLRTRDMRRYGVCPFLASSLGFLAGCLASDAYDHAYAKTWTDESYQLMYRRVLAAQNGDEPPYSCPHQYKTRRRSIRVFYAVLVGPYHIDHLEALLFEAPDLVHRFILLEADHTHSGEPTPLVLGRLFESGGRLSMYVGKVKWGAVQLDPKDCKTDSWICEGQHRDSLLRFARNAGMTEGDVLISGDVDEILSRDSLLVVARCELPSDPVIVVLPFHFYDFRWEWREWTNLLVIPARWIMKVGAPRLSELRREENKPWVCLGGPDRGWHLSFFGGPYAVRRKLRSYAHREMDIPELTDIDFITESIREGLHPRRVIDMPGAVLSHSVNLWKPRIVTIQSKYLCWLNAEDPRFCPNSEEDLGIESKLEEAEVQGSSSACEDAFYAGGLATASSGLVEFGSADTPDRSEALRGLQRSCEQSGQPTALLRAVVGLGRYIDRISVDKTHFRVAAILRQIELSKVVNLGLCTPIICLGDFEHLLLLLQHHFFSVVAQGKQMRLPPFRSSDVSFQVLPPLAERRDGRGLLPVRRLPGLRPGSPAELRLVLGHLSDEVTTLVEGDAVVQRLHLFLFGLRLGQVSARVVLLCSGGTALRACERERPSYEVECWDVEVLAPSEGGRGATASSVAFWLAAAEFLARFAEPAELVWVGSTRDTLFQADPFDDLSLAGSGLVLFAEPPAASAADAVAEAAAAARRLDRCTACLLAEDCSAAKGPAPLLSAAALLGRRGTVQRAIGAWAPLQLRAASAGGACDDAVTLAAALASKAFSWTDAALLSFCTLPSRRPLRVRIDGRGAVLNRRGRPCAIVANFRASPQLLDLAARRLPGRQARAPVPRLPVTFNSTA